MTVEIVKAARQNNLYQVQIELQKVYGNLTIHSYSNDGFSALHWAVHYNNPDMVDVLLAKCDIKAVLVCNNSGLTAIEYAAQLGYWDCLNVFLVNLASPDRSNKQYYYTGIRAIQVVYGRCLHLLEANLPPGLEPVDALIMAGADCSIENSREETPINSLLRKGFHNAIWYFAKRVTDKNYLFKYGMALYTLVANGKRTLPSMPENGVDDLIHQLLLANAFNNGYRPSDGNSLLHLAIGHDIPYWVHLLKSYGSDLKQKNNAGQTAVDFFLAIRHKLKVENAEYIAEILELNVPFKNKPQCLPPTSFKLYDSQFDDTQTTESEIVKKSVTQSIINLRRRYANYMRQKNWVENNLQEIKDYLFDLIDSPEKEYAWQCIEQIEDSNARLDNYYCNMREAEVLALIWEAICDTTAASDTKRVTNEYINLRKSALIDHLAAAEIDDSGMRVCFTGVMHQVVTSLQDSHPDVKIAYDDRIIKMDASENILNFVEQYLKTYSLTEVYAIYTSWEEERSKTPAARFRREAKEPVADLLRQTYGDSLNENSIREITNAFDDLPTPQLKNILPQPTEPMLEPFYKELLAQVTYNNKLPRRILIEYQKLITDILRMKLSGDRADGMELTMAISVLCRRYSQETDLSFAQKRQYLNEDYRALITLYNKLSSITQKHHNINMADNPIKIAAIHNINVTVKSACMLFASGTSSAFEAEQYTRNNAIQICSAAKSKLSFFHRKTTRLDLEEIVENVVNTIPEAPRLISVY